MDAQVVLPGHDSIPRQRTVGFAGNTAVASRAPIAVVAVEPLSSTRAVAYERILHQVMRREWRLLSELVTWAPADDHGRRRALTQHAELLSRVLLHHHCVERDRIWPALLRAGGEEAVRPALDAWTTRCGAIDYRLRDIATAARQWTVTGSCKARDAFALACLDLADDVDRQTAEEEASLLPLMGRHLTVGAWRAIARNDRCTLSVAEQVFVLGLALEDAPAPERARLLRALPFPARWAWRAAGRGRYRAAVVRLRGAPPAA